MQKGCITSSDVAYNLECRSRQGRQATPESQNGGLRTVVGLELVDDDADVVLNGAFGQVQRLGDLAVGLTLG